MAEGLPPGWIKEVRVTKKGHKIRKDPVLNLYFLFLVFWFQSDFFSHLIASLPCLFQGSCHIVLVSCHVLLRHLILENCLYSRCYELLSRGKLSVLDQYLISAALH